MKKLIISLVFSFGATAIHAQELQAKITVMSNRISTQTDKKIFQTLQTALSNFLNNRKWTSDNYQPHEKIKCNFLLNMESDLGGNVFRASLTVQAARPVYNTTYESPLINFMDNELVFRYTEFQPIEFNENRVQGNDPLVANLPAILAYYVNIILGLDYDSFSPRGGDPYFQKALNILNNSPEGRDIAGWKPFDGIRNRFRLVENLTDNRFALIHDALYSYYRTGLDIFYENENDGRIGILNTLNYLSTINRENPNTMIIQVFFQGKGTEIAKMFSRASTDVKNHARELLVRLDVTNAALYKELK
jgi:hypothetical protein